MRILIVGAGYVGLVTAVCFAKVGHQVICLDIDKKKIDNLNHGILPIYEPGLEELVLHNVREQRLIFTDDYAWAVAQSYVCFLALPTPSLPDGSCDTSYIESSVKEIAKSMQGYRIIVTKSTVPMGTAFLIKNLMQKVLKERGKKFSFDVASNPEFLKEGSALQDCLQPDRIILGAESSRALKALKEIYSPFNLSDEAVIEMDILSAEMTKYAANAMLATRISFMNEIAEICERVGANVNFVRKGIGSDKRIGHSFLFPGVGYGGSCFPKDIRALISLSKKMDFHPKLLSAVDEVNHGQKLKLIEHMESYFAKRGGIKGKTIAIWGLSFKPETDDMREAPSLVMIKSLLSKGAKLRLFDPIAMDSAKKVIEKNPNIHWCNDEFDAAKDADAITLVTEWNQFRNVDFELLLKIMEKPVLFDGRNQFKSSEMKKRGFDYIGIGVPRVIQDGSC